MSTQNQPRFHIKGSVASNELRGLVSVNIYGRLIRERNLLIHRKKIPDLVKIKLQETVPWMGIWFQLPTTTGHQFKAF